MPLSDLLNYSKCWPFENKTASWSRKEFGPSSFGGWTAQPLVGAMDLTRPSEAACGSEKVKLSTSSSPREVQCVEGGLSGSLNLSHNELVMTFSFWKILRHLFSLETTHLRENQKLFLETQMFACLFHLLKERVMNTLKEIVAPGEACCLYCVKFSFTHLTTKTLKNFSRNSFSCKNDPFSQKDTYIHRPLRQPGI